MPYFTTKRKPSKDNFDSKRAAKRRSLNLANLSVRSHFDPISSAMNNESPVRINKKKASKSRPVTKKCSQKTSFIKKAPITKSFK